MINIENLNVKVNNKEVLKNFNLNIKDNEVHVIMGPNGIGKSTLSKVIMGDTNYKVTKGDIKFEGKSLLPLKTDERSRLGIFLAMQYPLEIEGVSTQDFLKTAMSAKAGRNIGLYEFIKECEKNTTDLSMDKNLIHRSLNVGFSGGEKKRNEVVQMEMLKPSLSMLDEIDSGLDVDAMHIVANAVNKLQKETNMSMIIVSHYDRFFELIEPSKTHVLVDGKIVLEGDGELAKKIDREGYDWIYKEYDLAPAQKEEVKRPVSIGTCAVRTVTTGK